MARGEQSRPGPPLPAPYRSPWSALAEALSAVAADLRLALQRLWRRNREGDLSVPGFWPQGLAPLFWPLLLSALLLLLAALGNRLLASSGAARSAPTAAGASASNGAQPATRPKPNRPGSELLPQDGSARRDGRTAAPDAAATAGEMPAADGERRPSGPGAAWPGRARPKGPDSPANSAAAPAESAATAEAVTEASAGVAGFDADGSPVAPPATPELRLDPLLELINQGEDAGLLLAARPDPADSRLSLTLAAAAEALPQAELLLRAQRWQQRAREAGYERLELRDRQGRLRGRGALVGSGMILLAPVPGS